MLDTLIRGAKIVDGTGKAAFTADVFLYNICCFLTF